MSETRPTPADVAAAVAVRRGYEQRREALQLAERTHHNLERPAYATTEGVEEAGKNVVALAETYLAFLTGPSGPLPPASDGQPFTTGGRVHVSPPPHGTTIAEAMRLGGYNPQN